MEYRIYFDWKIEGMGIPIVTLEKYFSRNKDNFLGIYEGEAFTHTQKRDKLN